MILFLVVAALAAGAGIFFWLERSRNSPATCWPKMRSSLGFEYEETPPRLQGSWNGRKVSIESRGGAAVVTVELSAETSLRVECGPKAAVNKRAGAPLSDAVNAVSTAFRSKLLGRCSNTSAGAVIFDAAMQQRLAELAAVDFIGEGAHVVATVPVLKDVAETEALLGALCAIADGLEGYPRSGAMPNAQAKRP